MKYFALLLAISFSTTLIGQNPYFVQFQSNASFYNPASVGTQSRFSALLSHRNQWPESGNQVIRTTSAVSQFQIKQKSGLGILYLNDHLGNFGGTNSLKIQVSRIMKISNEAFSIGLEMGYNDQYSNPQGEFEDVRSPGVPDFASSYSFVGGIGAQYQSERIKGGVALRNVKVLEKGITFAKPDLTVNLGYTREIKEKLNIGIGGLAAYDLARFEIILAAAAKYKWLSINLAYRIESGPTGGLGVEVKKIQFRYSFDYYTQIPSNLLTSNPDRFKTAHELSLSYRITNETAKTFATPVF